MEFMISGLIIFVVSIFVIEIFFYSYRKIKSGQKKQIKKRLSKYTFIENESGDILKKRKLSSISFFDKFLASLTFVKAMDRLVMQANAKYPLGVYILSTFLLGAVGWLLGIFMLHNKLLGAIMCVTAMFLPYLYLVHLKNRRIDRFQNQLHEALDLIARALKAGHSFNSALQLAAKEFNDPLGPEFQETIDEINFGVSLADALKNLAARVDSNEIKYFVVAVIIQKETGGNLAELIESLAHILRERFKFEGKIKVLTSEGRISAYILIALPFLIAGWLQISNPEFLKPLFTQAIGRYMLGGAAILMITGIIIMKKMIKIEV